MKSGKMMNLRRLLNLAGKETTVCAQYNEYLIIIKCLDNHPSSNLVV